MTGEYINEHIKSFALEEGFAAYRRLKELDTAINDLLLNNYFSIVESPCGPYETIIEAGENRLILNIKSLAAKSKSKLHNAKISIPLRSFRSIIRDYFLICESYQEMLGRGNVDKVEAVDAGRRAMHNEGAEMLLKLLENRINMDFETARRLFTIIATLHMRQGI